MPEPTLTAPPAQTPVAAPKSTPSTAPAPARPSGSAVPSSAGEIRLDQLTQMPSENPGSRKSKMFEALQQKANKSTPQEAPKPAPKSAPQPEPKEPDQPIEAETPEVPPEVSEPADDLDALDDDPKVKPTEKGKKPSPWKIAEEYKKRSSQLEKELADLKSQTVIKGEYETLQSQLKELHERSAKMEEELKFVNYQKSDEFKKQYQEPYEAAWKRAMSELSEVNIDDGNGQSRPVQAQDILQLVNLPLPKAREAAKAMFGDFADDVMAHRKEIKSLFDAQLNAIEEAKTTGMEREKQRALEQQTHAKQTNEFIAKSWKEANQAIASDEKFGKYFSEDPDDGEATRRLKKGFEIVDKAWNQDPMDPRNTPEERAQIIRSHALIRNRAAAFGRLVGQNKALELRVAELAAELESYKNSEPARTGSESNGSQSQGRMPWRQRMQSELEKRAK